MIPLKLPKIGVSWKRKTFLSLELRISNNILQIGEAKVSKFKFMHTLSESTSIFAIEQKAIVSCFVKDVALLLGHLVYVKDMEVIVFLYHLRGREFVSPQNNERHDMFSLGCKKRVSDNSF